jgi:hypothetical protein
MHKPYHRNSLGGLKVMLSVSLLSSTVNFRLNGVSGAKYDLAALKETSEFRSYIICMMLRLFIPFNQLQEVYVYLRTRFNLTDIHSQYVYYKKDYVSHVQSILHLESFLKTPGNFE